MAAVDGFVFLVAQNAVLLAVAAGAGVLVGRYVWAGRRIRRLENDARRRRTVVLPDAAAARPPAPSPWPYPAPDAEPPRR